MIRTQIESLEMFKLVHKIFGSTHKTAYRYTENILDKYTDLLEYKYLHNSSKRLNQLKSNGPISLINGIQLGATTSEVRKKFKVTPYVQSIKSNGLRRHILLYKIKLGGQKVKIEAHFFKNELFFCKTSISYLNESEKQNAIHHFGEKYNLLDLEFKNKNIIDNSNNCVKLIDGTEFSINYLQLNNPFFEKIQQKTAIVDYKIPLTYGVNLGVQ